eukprot:CAMPEP_0198364706 /NCGR_PEP_ID=MMETSP1450-20131203/153800_1 /TAXON_ID=753684 ORGANISM="Madagascaria erythrocladiodes, Strain CCMP3234" /NCGR_SAMPLE_ID=MMETSP1450 /ASSEMBLY_ACC=CAM_ASM_001115 /LENGTH=200 /DNA_ID=CAMNT_0044072145 /DNA_START=77 /DNA_END=679 /DNA_ORIENTATION=+
MAFVSGAALPTTRTRATGSHAICMSSTSPAPARRALLAGIAAAALAPAAAAHASGDGPKYSIFGGGSQSSPFTYSMKTGGKPVYEKLNPEEVEFHVNMVKEGKGHLEATGGYIDTKNWEFVRAEIRSQMQNMRKSQLRLIEAVADQEGQKKSEEAYQKFKLDLEKLDFAARSKEQTKAYKARTEALKSLDNWASTAGVSI